MAGWLEKGMLLSLGVLTLTRDKVKQLVEKLVEEGEIRAEEAPGVIDRLVARGEAEREELRKLVRQELERVTPVSRRDIEELNQKIEALSAQVAELVGAKPSRRA